ncbi:MAG: helix-turn-helix transcriptional regulator [Solirubrobacteraceae bacterium]
MIVSEPHALGNAISDRRRSLGLTQERVADLIGVNRRVIGELERGKSTVQLKIAIDVCRVLGLDLHVKSRG